MALLLIVGLLTVVFWLILRTDQNTGPTLGTNNVGVLGPGEDGPGYLPTPIISEREELLRDSDRKLAEISHRARAQPATSWMEEPGAMESAGLVDRPAPDPNDPPSSTVFAK
ncbi:MAG: hypothetical protein JF887_13875 [Candidatus Dormibacteraeota bacterium]|uniref:Uncharacterized protein n=1 Tax=Candidatus Amunia macphersoniae TaxID=3127014 RepID=A0A934KFW4_9BACT|nr:hypothetical protein [Candidatus Dormibacteraeota bacterium]